MECDSNVGCVTERDRDQTARYIQQKLLNISKVDGQRSAVVRGVVRVVKLGSRLLRDGQRRTIVINVGSVVKRLSRRRLD